MRKWEKNKKNAIVLFLPICASTCDTILLQRWTWRVFIILSLVTGCCHRFGSWHVFWYHIRSKGGSRSTWLGKKGYIHIHHISSWYLFQDCKHCCLESHLIHTWRMMGFLISRATMLKWATLFLFQKNSAAAGAITGAALALTVEDTSHEQIVQCAITGAALSTAANLLTGIF